MSADRPLLAAAGMTEFDYNTGIVLSDDASFRVGVNNGLARWGDHVAIATCVEGQRAWRFAHFSPARARIIAMLLVAQADRLDALPDK